MKDWDVKLSKRRTRDGMTVWAQNLVNMQEEFEARMQSRSKSLSEKAATTPFVQSLMQKQKHFEDWNAAIMSDRQARASLTPWAKGLVRLQAKLEAQGRALEARRGHADQFDGMTAWGKNLEKMQEEFE